MALGLSNATDAAIYTYNFTGKTSDLSLFNFSNAIQGTLPLTNETTGINLTPGYELSVGDTLSGDVTLDNTISVPAGAYISYIGLYITGTSVALNNLDVSFQSTFLLYNHSSLISLPNYQLFGGSGINPGIIDDTSPETSGYTFDKIEYNVSITSLQYNGEPLQSFYIPAEPPEIFYFVDSPNFSAVPEPSSWMTIVLGSSMLGLLLRRRRYSMI